MKRIICILLLAVLAISLVSCGGKTGEETVSGELSPAIEHLRQETVLLRCTAKNEDLCFTKEDFCTLTGEETSYIVIKTLPESGVLMLGSSAVIAGQTVPVSSLNSLKYVPAVSEQGTAQACFTFTAKAAGWEERELACFIDLLESKNYPPVIRDVSAETFETVVCFADLGASDPEGGEMTYRVVSYPRHGRVTLKDGTAVYYPEEGYRGEDVLTYVAVDKYGETSGQGKVTFSVEENSSGIYFEDLADSPNHNAAIRLCAANVMTYRVENGKYYFDPTGEVSKIDCLVMMMCLMGQDEKVTAIADTQASDDGGLSTGKKGFLQTAIAAGWIYLEGGKFSPESPVTAADATYMAMRILGTPTLAAKQEFSDLQEAPVWACTALVSADSAGIREAKDGLLDAYQVLTREDLASLMENMLAYGKG